VYKENSSIDISVRFQKNIHYILAKTSEIAITGDNTANSINFTYCFSSPPIGLWTK